MVKISTDEQRYINQQSLLLLVASLHKVIVAFPITASILTFIFFPYVDHVISLLWLYAVYGVSIARYLVHKKIKLRKELNNCVPLIKNMLVLDFFSGFILGMSGYFITVLPPTYQLLMIIVAVAISMESIGAQSAIKSSFFSFNIPLFSCFSFWLFMTDLSIYLILITFILIHISFLLGNFKAMHNQIIKGLHLSFSNNKSANDLSLKNKQLLESNRQVKTASLAKSHFIAEISHQLKDPLQGMLNGLVQSQKFYRVDDILSAIKTVHSSGISLLHLLNNLIDINRLENGQLVRIDKSFNVREIFDDLISLMAINAESKGLFIYSDIRSNVPEKVVGDSLRLSQITLNLLANAIQFTEKGEVGLSLSICQVKEQMWLIIAIIDTGCGIADDEKEFIFQPFVHSVPTIKRIGQGLGLAISQELTHLLEGNISLVSVLGKGSIFTCKVPVDVSNKQSTLKQYSQQKILLIESNEQQRQAIINQFNYLQITVELANNAKEAMALCASNAGRYHAVIMGHQDKLQQKLLINLCQRIKLKYFTLHSYSYQSHHNENILRYPIKTTQLQSILNEE